jgi:hypothetical protein
VSLHFWICYNHCSVITFSIVVKPKKNHSTQDSRVVPHRGTNWAALWLTAQIGRDAVPSESYGRGYPRGTSPHIYAAHSFLKQKQACQQPEFKSRWGHLLSSSDIQRKVTNSHMASTPAFCSAHQSLLVAHTCLIAFWVQQDQEGNVKHSALGELLQDARVETANVNWQSFSS